MILLCALMASIDRRWDFNSACERAQPGTFHIPTTPRTSEACRNTHLNDRREIKKDSAPSRANVFRILLTWSSASRRAPVLNLAKIPVPYQYSFAANCASREVLWKSTGVPALVMVPAAELPMEAFGLLNWGVLKMLNPSRWS